MKFGKVLKDDAVPDWIPKYVAYKKLKRVVQRMELTVEQELQQAASKRGAAGSSDVTSPLATKETLLQRKSDEFMEGVEEEVAKVNHFYDEMVSALRCDLEAYEKQLAAQLAGGNKKAFQKMFVLASDLNAYITLNSTAFRKIMKKHDKLTGLHRMDAFVARIKHEGFMEAKALRELSARLEAMMSPDALDSLKQQYHLERQKRSESAGGSTGSPAKPTRILFSIAVFFLILALPPFWSARPASGGNDDGIADVSDGAGVSGGVAFGVDYGYEGEPASLGAQGGVGEAAVAARDRLMRVLWERHYARDEAASSSIGDYVSGNSAFGPTQEERAHRCFALLIFIACMWVLEALPYFVTSLMIPPLVVMLNIMADPTDKDKALSAPDSSRLVLSSMFDHVLILLLGGFTLSAAFGQCAFELRIAGALQRALGHRPWLFMLAIMLLSLFLCMWLSNVTAPVLMLSVLLPILRDFDHGGRYPKALLLGLAFACNLGGMVTPIASPQNAVALVALDAQHFTITFFEWMAVALPFCVLLVVVVWAYLIFALRPDDVVSIPPVMYKTTPLSSKHIWVLLFSLATIGLWSTLSLTVSVLGDLGIIALLFMVFAFGTGVLSKHDLNSFSWHLLLLIAGGNVLGRAVQSSGLIQIVAQIVTPYLHDILWVAALELLAFMIIITTFVSHSVAAIIMMPLIVAIGKEISPLSAEVLVLLCTLADSAAMALPMTSFPNVNSLLVEDDYGVPYLRVVDFIKVGAPVSIMVVTAIATLGYSLAVFVLRP
eukprot:jgi/Mesvir1/25557/Mv01794-RA.1